MKAIRCVLGFHDWQDWGDGWSRDWHCSRCEAVPKTCTNCGGKHDPTAAIIVCTVRRGPS